MARREDLETIARGIVERKVAFGSLPYSAAELDALHRQLPHLLACAKFVEEHGEIVDIVLDNTFSHADDGFTMEREAHAALEQLRLSRDGTVKP